MADVELGIIGGSGLYDMPELETVDILDVETPFGSPSSPITVGNLKGVTIAFVARHGRVHNLLPSEVPYRANIYALKTLGLQRVLSVSAVGSLCEEYAPLNIVVPDQVLDRTKNRPSTFFGKGLVAHVAFAQPFCPAFSTTLNAAARSQGATSHAGGTLVVMEGPQFSTAAESEAYRKLGCSLIGMTALPEAKLAREAELCYATLAMVTDYDVWHQTHETVTSDMVTANIHRNTEVAHAIIRDVIGRLGNIGPCDCSDALSSALLTPLDQVPNSTLAALEPIVGRYLRRAAVGGDA